LYVILSSSFSHSQDILGTLCSNIRVPKFGIDVPYSQYNEAAVSSGTVTLSALEKVVEFGGVTLEVMTIMEPEGEQDHMSGRHNEIRSNTLSRSAVLLSAQLVQKRKHMECREHSRTST
jgi:hypothetical protein